MSGVIGILIGFALGIIVHEAGHFACAAIGGISIRLVSVGVGPVVLRARLGTADLVLRALPISGLIVPVTYQNTRKAWAVLFVLGGVLGNCVLIGLVGWLDHITVPSTLPQFIREGFGPIVVAQVVLIISNLFPSRGRANGHRIGSDGLQLIELLRGRHALDAAYRAYCEILRRYGAEIDTRPSAAWNRIVVHPSSSEVWTSAFARSDVLATAERELARGALRPAEELWVLDHLITVGLVSGAPEFRSHLDRWSQRARELGPDITTLKGSRGAVLVELGQFEAGRALLQELAVANDGRAIDVVMTKIFLAWAEQGLGNDAAAQALLQEAPIQCWLSSGR
jgi:hypothetical protein